MSAEIIVRKLEEKDLPELIKIHRQAFKGYMNTQLGDEYIYGFLKWFASQPDSIALIVLQDNSIRGYVVGASIGYESGLTKHLAGTVMQYLILHPWLLLHKRIFRNIYLRFKGLFVKRKSPNLILENRLGVSLVGIGIADDARGKNFGTALISEFEKQAASLGFNYMRLSVYSDNDTAIRFYKKNEWKLMAEEGKLSYYNKLIK